MSKRNRSRQKKKRVQARQSQEARDERSRQDRKERVYYVEGMHCPACEILVEKKLIAIPNFHSVEASTSKERAVVEYVGQAPGVGELNKLFEPHSRGTPVRFSGIRILVPPHCLGIRYCRCFDFATREARASLLSCLL
jgi:copper chaperone CopZ